MWAFVEEYMKSNIRNTATQSIQTITPQLQGYFAQQPIDKAWVFGSFARGEQDATSDVDLLVRLDTTHPMGLAYFGMIADLEKLLHRPVDLVVDGDLLPYAAQTADRDKVLVYERK